MRALELSESNPRGTLDHSGHHSVTAAAAAPKLNVIPIRPRHATDRAFLDRRREAMTPYILLALRLSLAIIFCWFGFLKVVNVSPVVNLLRASIPVLATAPYFQLLGLVEIVIGVGLCIRRLTTQATFLMILHLLGTMSLLVIAPRLIFAPAFPILTMDGEFVVKNLVLIAAALAVICLRSEVTPHRRPWFLQERGLSLNKVLVWAKSQKGGQACDIAILEGPDWWNRESQDRRPDPIDTACLASQLTADRAAPNETTRSHPEN